MAKKLQGLLKTLCRVPSEHLSKAGGGGRRRKSDLKVFGLTANMKGLPVQCEHSQPETPAD